jgi:3'-5' exoribonuclease
MGRRFVQQLGDGEAVEEVYLVSEKQLRANRKGDLYIQVELRDRTGAISGRLWNAGEQLFRTRSRGRSSSSRAACR